MFKIKLQKWTWDMNKAIVSEYICLAAELSFISLLKRETKRGRLTVLRLVAPIWRGTTSLPGWRSITFEVRGHNDVERSSSNAKRNINSSSKYMECLQVFVLL